MLGLPEILLLVVIFAIPVLLAWGAFRLARRKGRDAWVWAVLTLVFLPSLLILAFLPAVPAR